MTDEQINAAITEAIDADPHWKCAKDYCTDLNAMAEAEEWLNSTDRNHYIDSLGGMFKGSWEFATATARQRAEAFLKTLGKWEKAEKLRLDERLSGREKPNLDEVEFGTPHLKED